MEIMNKWKSLLLALLLMVLAVSYSTTAHELEVRENVEFTEHVMALHAEISALEVENQALRAENDDLRGTMIAVNEIIKVIDYNTILIRAEETNLWLRTVEQFMEVD